MDGLRFLLRYARRYTGPLAVTVASMILLVALQLLAPRIVREIIVVVTEPGAGQAALDRITQLAPLALGAYVLRAGFTFLRSYLSQIAGWGVVSDARQEIYDHLQRLSLRFYDNRQTGQLMSRMVNDSEMFERLIAHALPDTLVNVLLLVGVCLVLGTLNPQLLLLSLVPVPLIVLGMRGFAKYVRPAFRQRQQELGELSATLNDNLSGIREIKAFVQEEAEATRIGDHIRRFLLSNLKALRMMAMFHPSVEFAASLGTVIIIYFGARLVVGPEALAGADRVAELLAEEPDVVERADALDLTGRAEGTLAFHDVSFSYDRGEMVLEHIDLKVPPRTVVALVGPTGVGKTTLVSLIPRFYDICSGSITLDGHDIRDLTLKSLRRQLSIVLQDVFLFHGTVRENILFGSPGADDEEIVQAAVVANAHGFIARLPDRYETVIGERGVRLSGGQKQRLAIARAVLKDAPVLILDEATSSVDTETELLIQQALERLMAERTTLIIAHRLSTIRNADVIVVLEGNSIKEIGTHEELIASDGLYRHLNLVQERFQAASAA